MVRYHYKLRYQSADEVITALNNYQQQNHNLLSTEMINNLPSTTSQTKETVSELLQNTLNSPTIHHENQFNSFGDWLKSPLGSTITTALTIGLIATGGDYFMNAKEQARIKKEQQDFITLLDTKYNSQAYVECFEKAEEQLKTENNNIPSKILSEYIGKCRLEKAKEIAQFSNYGEALSIANEIPRENEYYNQAQIMSEDWSRSVFEKAKKMYTEEGKLEEALKEIDTIPDNDIKKASLIVVSKWQEEYQKNSYLITQAQKDLEYENCEAAIETVSQIYGSNYWLLEGKKIVDKAQKCLSDRDKESHNSDSKPNKTSQKSSPDHESPPDTINLCPGPLCPDN
jgi:serine/threonine-protein kinase